MKSKLLLICMLCLFFVGCSGANKSWIQERANEKWNKQGFEVLDYEGFNYGFVIPFTSYGGAYVWYRLKRTNDSNLLYSGCLSRWGDELQVWGPKPIESNIVMQKS